MINFKKFTAKDYKIMLLPSIAAASLFELMLLWNFADTLSRTINIFGKLPNLTAQGASDMLYINCSAAADSFCLALAFAFGIAVLCSVQKSATPFNAYVGKGMRAIAVSEILSYVLRFAVKRIIAAVMTVPTAEYLGYFGIGCIALMGLLIVISFIFDYGCELQRESDETL